MRARSGARRRARAHTTLCEPFAHLNTRAPPVVCALPVPPKRAAWRARMGRAYLDPLRQLGRPVRNRTRDAGSPCLRNHRAEPSLGGQRQDRKWHNSATRASLRTGLGRNEAGEHPLATSSKACAAATPCALGTARQHTLGICWFRNLCLHSGYPSKPGARGPDQTTDQGTRRGPGWSPFSE